MNWEMHIEIELGAGTVMAQALIAKLNGQKGAAHSGQC